MNHQGQMLRSSRRPLWECILDRHKYRSRLLRARVPLVFRRISSPANFYQRPRLLTPVAQYPLNLHLQFSWPLLSVKETRFRETIKQSGVIRRHRQRVLDQPMPARVQLSSLINSYAIVNALRDQLHTASTVFKSAGRVPFPPAPVSLDQTAHVNIQNAFTHSSSNPRFSTNVEVNHSVSKVESGGTSVRDEDPARKTFPEIVLTSRRHLAADRDVTPRLLVTASDPRISHHQTETANQTPTASPPVFSRLTTTTRFTPAPAANTESTRGSFVPLDQRLYRQPASRDFASPAAHADEKQSAQPEPQSSRPQRPAIPQPSLDIGQLSEEVYRHIQRKLRIERERRGL